MTVRTAEPLPECRLCDRPTARTAWDRNGGLCTDCADGITATVRMLLPAGVTDLAGERDRRARLQGLAADQADATVYVERYLPPVPGQLRINDED